MVPYENQIQLSRWCLMAIHITGNLFNLNCEDGMLKFYSKSKLHKITYISHHIYLHM